MKVFDILTRKPFPWDGKQSIYRHIKSHLDPNGRLPDEFSDLPDEDTSTNAIRFAPGAMDGILTQHQTPTGSSKDMEQVLGHLENLSQRPSSRHRARVYEMLMKDEAIDFIDSLLEAITKSNKINRTLLYKEALWMAKEAAHRTVVKFGISILGLYHTEANMDDLLVLGKHEEFTLYVAVAIQNRSINVNELLFQLAQDVHGWGKIHVVERLEPSSPQIRQWLLERGCENKIMPEYLACVCARKGELQKALGVPTISKELYEGAGTIISALINGGPAEDIDDYEYGAQVICDYLRHSRRHATTLRNFNTISLIRDFLMDEELWYERFEKGWSPQIRDECLKLCTEIMQWPIWVELVHSNIHSTDRVEQWEAKTAAAKLDIDVWPVLFQHVQKNPLNDGLYFDLMRTNDLERIKQLVCFAEQALPLAEIASGAGNSMGLGAGFEAHSCLDFILQELDRYEGIGGNLILAGLKSPVIRNRYMALQALKAWGLQSWPEGAYQELQRMSKSDPDEGVMEEAAVILAKLH